MTKIGLRNQPQQARALKTLEHILDTTAKLLDQYGYASLNTNAIAKESGLAVATLYNYFPNKESIIETLLQRMNEKRIQVIYQAVQKEGEWREVTKYTINCLLEFMLKEPGYITIKDAVNSSEKLQALEVNKNRGLVDELFKASSVKLSRKSKEQLNVVAEVVQEAASSVIKIARNAPNAKRHKVQQELVTLIISYLENYAPLFAKE